MLTLDRIYHASYVLKNAVRPTDIIKCSDDVVPGVKVYLKTENLQVTGSFKVRGAYYKISQLTDEEKAKGVIACSAGNHAQGVARAATKMGIKSLICIPDAAPISKIEATKRLGAEVCLVKGTYDDAYAKAVELQKESGATFIDIDAVIVPVGGGGLVAGVAFAIKSLNPNIKVYGVQAEGAPSMVNSVKHGQIETLDSVHTFQDGIAVKTPGTLTYEITSKYVDDLITVTDDECAAAILKLIERQKLKKVCCLLSGGNIDVTILSRVINRGLQMSGRLVDLTIELIDKPGQLQEVSDIIANMGGNVVSVAHDRADLSSDINACYLRISMETRNQEHADAIKNAFNERGYKII